MLSLKKRDIWGMKNLLSPAVLIRVNTVSERLEQGNFIFQCTAAYSMFLITRYANEGGTSHEEL